MKPRSFCFYHSTKPQQKPKCSTFKPKEDWDDSTLDTLDSTRVKMKIQNRLEAMTRRGRALAYAFFQLVTNHISPLENLVCLYFCRICTTTITHTDMQTYKGVPLNFCVF